MKHPFTPTVLLVLLFVMAQITGLIIIGEYIDIQQTHETGKTVTNTSMFDLSGMQVPEVEDESLSWIVILISVMIGTAIVLLIIKFKKKRLWQIWYLLAVFIALRMALSPLMLRIIGETNTQYVISATLALSIFLALLKVFKPNIYIHNLTEIFIYGGIAALLVPVINMFSAVVLLILISIYDIYAVWKSKHMVTMAQFQEVSQVFAGLSVPYKPFGKRRKGRKSKKVEEPKVVTTVKTAILGGGDIAFPLMFSGAVMKTTGSFVPPLIITATTTIALTIILWKGKKGKFYPAMPFLSLGCFAGLLLAKLLIGF